MRKVFTFMAAALLTASVFAQSPEKMSYQAVIRDASDNLVTEQEIGMQISILQGSANGTAVYVESQNPTTNANGLVSVEIGTGTTTDDFSTIDWESGPYFIKTETDPAGGTDYTITGTSQLLSVPYAMHAKTAETVTGEITETDPIFSAWDKNYADLTNKPTAISDFTMSASSQNITNLADPVNDQDAASKAYVDALLSRIEALERSDLLNNGFTDPRDDNYYNVVEIGNQLWMVENLKYLPEVQSNSEFETRGAKAQPGYGVLGYDGSDVATAKAQANYATYGVLYNWWAAMDGASDSESNPSGIQGVCPAGWHLPSDAEWTELTDYLGGGDNAGGKLKETGTTHWRSPNTGATNEAGFTALPGSIRSKTGSFANAGDNGYWWSTTERWSTEAFYRNMNFNLTNVMRNSAEWNRGFSVRCIKD